MSYPKLDWKAQWPREAGNYYFYGWPFKDRDRAPELNYVVVKEIGRGVNSDFVYIRSGHFFYESEDGMGLFAKIPVFILPDHQLRALTKP